MDPSQLQPGYRLDRYELLCPLAYGGMASVWLARFGGRLGFERMVVIKMILPQYSQDPRFQEMFLDEARIASKIEHPNVARILDVGEQEENYFIVMEWVDGDSLSKILRAAEQRNEAIPIGVALRIIADAAAGLHAAHELKERDGTRLGVVHRDVSPQNLLVANGGATMIIDFGVAKARDRVSQETSAGQLKGKIRYMAPEQALGKPIDHRADVWALGAMLYEMFTGSPPYDGANEVATLHKLTSGQRPPPIPRAQLPDVVASIVDKALGYEPHERFATAEDLGLALEAAMVELNDRTTTALVAHYTGQLLADRKAARRRAVDAALDAANKRENGVPISSPVLPIGPPSTGQLPPSPVSSARFTPGAPMYTVPMEAAPTGRGSRPEIAHQSYASHGLGESPSATSSATFGSAIMEYPPVPATDDVRQRRYLLAAGAGVLGAAFLVGAVLIISTAMMKHDPPGTGRPSEPPPTAQTVQPVTTAATAATTVATAATTVATAEPPPSATTPTPPPSSVPTTTAANTAATTTPEAPSTASPSASVAHKTVPVTPSTTKPGGKTPSKWGF